MSQTSPEIESLIESLLQASVDYERCERFDAKHRRLDLEEAKQAIRNALTSGHAQTPAHEEWLREAITNAIIDNMPTLNGLNAAVAAIMATVAHSSTVGNSK